MLTSAIEDRPRLVERVHMVMPAVYADLVRNCVQQQLAELGCDTSAGLHETILIRQGTYCGRRFNCEGGYAIWFIEENQLKFYAEAGALRHVCAAPGQEPERMTLPLSPSAQRRAA